MLTGQWGTRWLAARVQSGGTLDPAFGNGGWTVLPEAGGASAVAQAPWVHRPRWHVRDRGNAPGAR